MQLRLKDIVRQLEQIAPPEYAASWDNTGLQIGGSFDRIHSILVALDITHGVIHEAVKKKVDLIITHHPLFFRPIKRIRTDSGTGRLVQRLLREEITVYAAHTNLDVVQDGVNDILGKAMGLEEWSLIQDVTLPEGNGWGRISALKDEKPFEAFTADLKESLQLDYIRVIGNSVKRVRKIAWCSGSGASLFPEVVRHKPDIFITGDVKYHDALDFQMEGITVVDIGHFASEQGIRKALAKRLRQSLKKLGSPIPVYTSRSELDPFKVL